MNTAPAARFSPHPDFESYTTDELKAEVNELEDKIKLARDAKDGEIFTWFTQEKRIALAELQRRNTSKPFAAGQEKFWPELISAEQILSLPPDPTRWVLDQTLPVGGCSVLVSKPKVGKSTFAATLALCISRGIPFLERTTQQSSVAYLSLDASLPEMAEVFISLGLKKTDPIFIHAGAAPKDALGWMTQRVKESSVRFVIVDTLQRLFRFQDLNDYSQVTNTMEPLLEAMREQGCHVLFTHHAKKDMGDDLDSAIGSTAIRGLAYSYLHLKRLPESERRILRSDQRGGKNFSETALGFDRDGRLEIQGSRQDAEVEETQPKIRELLESNDGGLTEKEIRAEVKARGIIVSKALRALYKADEVQRTGKGRRGEAFRYSLAASLINSPSFSSRDGGMGEGFSGRESNGTAKPAESKREILFPKDRELNGNSREENGRANSKTVEDALRIFQGRIQQ